MLKTRNIQKLTHIYQEQFSNWKSSGLGDFIRGSFFIMQFCDKFNIEYEISFKNHLLYNFFKNSNINDFIGSSDMSIIKYLDNNFIEDVNNITKVISYKTLPENIITNSFMQYIINNNDINIKNININVNTICFPLYYEIDKNHKKYMKNIMEPTDDIKQYVINHITNMNLIIDHYNVIHIRCGDDLLIHNKTNNILFNVIYNKLSKILDDNILNEDYVIISDSNELKKNIKNKFPSFKINTENIIVHLGEGNKNTEETIKSLLFDFYLMAYSKNIIGLSSYTHGTGLSLWCSTIYDIPYKCYYLL
jgi:hypothetical protein